MYFHLLSFERSSNSSNSIEFCDAFTPFYCTLHSFPIPFGYQSRNVMLLRQQHRGKRMRTFQLWKKGSIIAIPCTFHWKAAKGSFSPFVPSTASPIELSSVP